MATVLVAPQPSSETLKPPETEGAVSLAALASSWYYTASQVCQQTKARARVLSVPHVSQEATWDCGLACVLMILRSQGNTSEDLSSLKQLCKTKSVWTIDLAHLLRQFGWDVRFTTLTLGANPAFFSETFYGEMKEDEVRVNRLFEAAEEQGIVVEQRCVSDRELQRCLSEDGMLVIALVDKSILVTELHLWSDRPSHPQDRGYTGHYIVLCGYAKESDEYIIRDPDPRTASMGLCSISARSLNAARRAFGTDEDLLFVEMYRALNKE